MRTVFPAITRNAEYTRQRFLAKHSPSPQIKLRVQWEEACLELSSTGRPELMLKLIKRNGSHHSSGYLLEASLWMKTLPQREWMERTILVRSLARRWRGKVRAHVRLYQAALALEQCYESTIPLLARLNLLGKMLAKAPLLLNIEHELLIWAAAARFLARNNAFELATLASLEYAALSRRLSQSEHSDGLGVLGDMLKRPWFLQVSS